MRPVPLALAPVPELWRAAEYALRGVGDPTLGEWRESGNVAVHIRRRLTPKEWGDRPWGMDYRGLPEGAERLQPAAQWIPPALYAEEMRRP